MQIYRYRRGLTRFRMFFLSAVVLLAAAVTVGLSLSLYHDLDTRRSFVFVVWALAAVVGIYTYMMVRITQTAVLTLDDSSIGYHDCFLRMSIAWRDVEEMTPSSIRANDGRAIVLKLGVDRLENWESFAEMVVRNAGLSAVPRGGGVARFWSRVPAGAEKAT